MNNVKSILRSPISVKLLIVIYTYSIYNQGSHLFRPDIATTWGYPFIIINIVFSVALISLIYFKIRWSWIVGIGECFYFTVSTIYLLKETEFALDITKALQTSFSQSPDHIKMIVNLSIYGRLGLGAIITGFLWYRSRSYLNTK